ncbi:I78 family peptidase inhibitor [Pseudomonas sp. RIT-To-2]|uniref:I78 family peptidase inhibitor n=1 Tax=Pseudomonas sp. RIT-To-2 TaxID=3462541 RepID=UPI002413892B
MTNDQVIAAIAHLVGTQYEPGVKAQITQLTERARVVGPNEMSTREYDLNRVHIVANATGTIEAFTFG